MSSADAAGADIACDPFRKGRGRARARAPRTSFDRPASYA
jgi:hypothetical protein